MPKQTQSSWGHTGPLPVSSYTCLKTSLVSLLLGPLPAGPDFPCSSGSCLPTLSDCSGGPPSSLGRGLAWPLHKGAETSSAGGGLKPQKGAGRGTVGARVMEAGDLGTQELVQPSTC